MEQSIDPWTAHTVMRFLEYEGGTGRSGAGNHVSLLPPEALAIGMPVANA